MVRSERRMCIWRSIVGKFALRLLSGLHFSWLEGIVIVLLSDICVLESIYAFVIYVSLIVNVLAVVD